MTRVVHCKKEPYDLYIGRPSIWGNPFIIGKDGSRDEVCEKYHSYLLSKPELIAQLPSVKGKVLACWCHPLRCHGDIIAELADKS